MGDARIHLTDPSGNHMLANIGAGACVGARPHQHIDDTPVTPFAAVIGRFRSRRRNRGSSATSVCKRIW
jgi:hypothetical protein